MPRASTLPRTRERAMRAALSIVCEARQGVQPWRMLTLTELSARGFRVIWTAPLNPRQALRLRIPGMAPLTAAIRWHRDDALGCEFLTPLHVAVFEHIVRSDRRAVA
ncbi:MAG: PilZ domain-containing protein [Sphingomonadales bacterium]|nr:PilZ domain-containing protein [Sphingomonadales bacterium]